MQNEIFRAALSSNRGDNSMNSKEQKFLFRIRDKTLPGFAFKDEDEEMIGTAVTRSTEFFNCYCFYKQVDAGKDVPPYRQAVVLISKWPFPQLAFNMLDKLEEAINWQLNSIDPSLLEKIDEPVVVNSVEGWQEFEEKTTELSLDEIEEASRTQQQQQSNRDIPLQTVENALMAAMSQTNIWPLPCPGSIMYLNFFGEMLNYVVPNDLLNDYSTNLNFRSVLLSINLVSVFGPLGLLQHIWALWELLVMGKDIAVVAPTPALASELVLAIASLLQPVTSIGDLRPYIHGEDSDLMVMAATAQLKQVREQEFEDKTDHFYKIAARKRSMVVGVTDPIALAKLEEFHAVLFIYVPTKNAQLSTSDAAYKGLRTKNSADFFALSPVPSGPKSPVKLNSKAKQPDSFVSAFHTWREKDTKKCGIASRVLPSSFSLDKVLSKIKRMHPDDRLLLGDQLLRENLLDITDSFFAPQTKQRMSIVVDREELVQEKHELNMQKQSISMIKEAEEKGMVKLAMDDFKAGVRSIPEWIRNNVPTVILWTLFSILGGVVIYFGVPIVVVAITALVVKLPEKASLSFELFLRQILPSKVLYPKSHALQEHNHPHSHADEQSGEGINVVVQKFERIVTGKQDLSGVWKRVRTINYEEVLAAQGAGFVQRKLGASISMVHTITMDADLKSFRLQEKAGPIDTDNTYTIDGPELPTITVKTRFLDKVSWTDDGKLRIRKLKSPEQNYELVIYRWLEIGGKSLVVVS